MKYWKKRKAFWCHFSHKLECCCCFYSRKGCLSLMEKNIDWIVILQEKCWRHQQLSEHSCCKGVNSDQFSLITGSAIATHGWCFSVMVKSLGKTTLNLFIFVTSFDSLMPNHKFFITYLKPFQKLMTTLVVAKIHLFCTRRFSSKVWCINSTIKWALNPNSCCTTLKTAMVVAKQRKTRLRNATLTTLPNWQTLLLNLFLKGSREPGLWQVD